MLCICHSVIYDCFICHPDNVRIYTVFLTPSFVMEVFLFFPGGEDLDPYSRRYTRNLVKIE